ncbi:MAG: ribosomal RNA small subunit methyltransferase A [Clostridia bacterium]|nr:ribosomal RNA small subunit methyltransferase A [Clostridia bacterium]
MSLKEVLVKHGFHFNKKFGQNFISDGNLLSSIAELSGVTASDVVVEIGVGAGTLTRETASRAKRVIGYEIDENLKPVLSETLSGVENAEVVFRDFMKVKTPDFEREVGEDYIVIANLPYYITTPVIMKLIEEAEHCKRLVIMVQEEVALRLAAREDTPEYGAITASVGIVGDARIVKRVPRNMFYPVPNVDSAVVRIDICPPKHGVEDLKLYRSVVRAAFLSRRKTLANNLMQAFKMTRIEADGVIAASGIDSKARGETLSTEGFARLTAQIANFKK